MKAPPLDPGGVWLSLQQASRRLDVHPATLRHWADRGRIRSYRTPGGHRRFLAEDVAALTRAGGAVSAELELLLSAAVGRARLEANSGRLQAEPWYRRFDEAAKERHRDLGRRLLTLLVRHLQESSDPEAILTEARPIGREYGTLARHLELSLGDAMRAFLLFRDVIIESVLQMAAVQGGAEGTVDLHRRVSGFVNEVLVAMVEAYSE